MKEKKKKITKKKTPTKTKAKPKRLKTDKQKKLLELISVNIGKKKPLTMEEMMLKAGYSKTTARQQSASICKIKESKEFGSYIDRLKKHREKIILRMEKILDTAKYHEISNTLSRIENILLLADGKPTSNVNILSDEEKKKLDDLFDDNS